MKTKYEVRFTPRFSKNSRVLSKEDQIKVFQEVSILKTNPYAGKPLRGEWKGVYSLRVGMYRVLYQVKGEEVFPVDCETPKTCVWIALNKRNIAERCNCLLGKKAQSPCCMMLGTPAMFSGIF